MCTPTQATFTSQIYCSKRLPFFTHHSACSSAAMYLEQLWSVREVPWLLGKYTYSSKQIGRRPFLDLKECSSSP
jgi:hypothetical protein